ncbi:hypothetical protein [Actinomadura sp. 6N118]|uniref:hypothetical protein n=1 Tax=Actinomadura sp. 6N118 TaxID=3375151 RepID=UPI00378C474F
MAEERQTYKGREIIVRPRAAGAARESAMTERAGAEAAEAELYIDQEPISTVRDSAGMYVAAGYAYDPQNSLKDLGRRIIDYREAARQG